MALELYLLAHSMRSLVRSAFILSFLPLFLPSFVQSFSRWFALSLVHPFMPPSLPPSLPPSSPPFFPSLTQSSTHPPTHPPIIHASIHPSNHSFSHFVLSGMSAFSHRPTIDPNTVCIIHKCLVTIQNHYLYYFCFMIVRCSSRFPLNSFMSVRSCHATFILNNQL